MGNDAAGVLLTWLKPPLPSAVWSLLSFHLQGMKRLSIHHLVDQNLFHRKFAGLLKE